MRKSHIKYVSGTGRQTVELDAMPVWVGTANDFRSRAWDYTLQYRGITGASRPAREVDMDAWVLDLAEADRMRRVFDRDVMLGTPGTFTVNGVWVQRAYVVACEAKGIYGDTLHLAMTAVLLDGAWRRENVAHYTLDSGGGAAAYDYLDYSHDYMYDYSRNTQPDSVTSTAYMPSPIRLVVFGPATNPAITIGGNRYQVNATVPAGGYLVVDGIDKAIASVTVNGTITNLFDKGVRGTGEGSGDYIFEPLPPGTSDVVWNRSYAFDLYYYTEEGEPPWA